MNYQNVVIVGTWSIGTNVAREITESQWLGNGHEHPSRLVWLVNSQKIVVPRNSNLVNLIVSGAMTQEQLRVEMWSNWVDREKDAGYEDVIALLEKQWWSMGDIVVIDTTADKRIEAMSFHQEVLARGGKVVTANKNPVSLFEVEKFWNLTRDRRSYRYGASVMAWAPAVTALQRAFDTRNKIKHIEGCFSWTLGFLCSGLDDGKQLSVVLADAIEKKFTEPNPWDDLNGLDVARKILILARTAGFPLNMEDVIVEPFLPEEFGQYDAKTLVEKVKEIDGEWSQRVKSLKWAGKVLRYVAELTTDSYGRPKVRVWLREVDKASPLWQLKGTLNKIAITTKMYGTREFTQKWAGVDVTTAGILEDLSDTLPQVTA